MTQQWSTYQQAIFEQVADRSPDAPHLAVRARAGSGKTTTGVHALSLTPQDSGRVCALAFNSDIAATLKERVPQWCDARTFHSAGFAAVRSAMGSAVKVEKDKLLKLARRAWHQEAPSYFRALARTVSIAKSTLADITDPDVMGTLALRYHIDGIPEVWQPAWKEFCGRASRLAMRSAELDGTIDFDDMCWYPIHHNMSVRSYGFVLADEAQDLNACQHELVKKLVGKRGRLLAIGDDRQAIYQFRGAAAGSFDSLANFFDSEILPLSVCYRCDAAIIAVAQGIVSDIVARDGAPDGVVRECVVGDMDPQPGDFVLSRTKAPLLGHCMRLLADGMPATIVGRDIAGGLLALVKKSKAQTLRALDVWLSAHQDKAAEKLLEAAPDAFEELTDRIACVRAVVSGLPKSASVADLTGQINSLFSDASARGQVRLSTTHKAKGLEADRVFVLADTYMKRGGVAEENLWYVAVTRARHELVKVYKETPGDGEKEKQ